MTALESALENIDFYTKKYRECAQDDGNTMVECLKQISATLSYLENARAEYHKAFQAVINLQVESGDSVSRAENKAHVQVPQMYLLRRKMDAGYKTCEAIRSSVSWIKSGLVNP
jgi:hypothetical protein